MLKPLIVILIIVSLLALALNFNLFDSNTIEATHSTVTIKNQPFEIEKEEKEVVKNTPSKEIKVPHNDSKIINELKKLSEEASKYFQKGDDTEALRLYDLIIEKSENSSNLKVLRLFSDASFSKAYIYNIYPNSDLEATLEEYERVINKFKNRDEKELLLLYMTARLQSAQYTSKDEVLNAYEEIIQKFQNDKEQRFTKEIEQMLFSKSFALMGVNDEEAMDALDNIISAYQDKGVKELPETVQFSILNNIELSIITNNNDEKYVDLANKYLSKSPDTKPLLKMLDIIKNSQDLNQDSSLQEWQEEHSDYHFPDWDFSELKKWASSMEDIEQKQRVRSYIDAFEKQKYSRTYAEPYIPQRPKEVYVEREQNSEENVATDSYEVNNDTPVEYGDPIEYETDPYIDDIYQNNDEYQPSYPSPEVAYDNPYLHSNADGVTHVYSDPKE